MHTMYGRKLRTDFVKACDSEAIASLAIKCAQDIPNTLCAFLGIYANGVQERMKKYSFSLILRGSGQSPEKKDAIGVRKQMSKYSFSLILRGLGQSPKLALHLLDNIVLIDTLQ